MPHRERTGGQIGPRPVGTGRACGNTETSMNDLFREFAQKVSAAVGSRWAFLAALLIVAVWAVVGPYFHYSDTWQLVINTGTTIITFLMVFLIQYTQNRDVRAIHLKLDELIRSVKDARNSIADVEEQSDQEMDRLHSEFKHLPPDSKPSAAPVANESR
jgi:low affinity Fe/Cu permease